MRQVISPREGGVSGKGKTLVFSVSKVYSFSPLVHTASIEGLTLVTRVSPVSSVSAV